jgi:hypothetical protein
MTRKHPRVCARHYIYEAVRLICVKTSSTCRMRLDLDTDERLQRGTTTATTLDSLFLTKTIGAGKRCFELANSNCSLV